MNALDKTRRPLLQEIRILRSKNAQLERTSSEIPDHRSEPLPSNAGKTIADRLILIGIGLAKTNEKLLTEITERKKAEEIVRLERNKAQKYLDNISITFHDDGVDFQNDRFISYEQRVGGFGLFNIRERPNYINESFDIESQSCKRSRITLIALLKVKIN